MVPTAWAVDLGSEWDTVSEQKQNRAWTSNSKWFIASFCILLSAGLQPRTGTWSGLGSKGAGFGHIGHTLRQSKISWSLRCNDILLERMRHYATVRFNNARGRKTYGRALKSGNREAEGKCLSACTCPCLCVHACRWKRESRGKGFTGHSNIMEKKIRNTYLWYQKRGLKYSH